MMSDNYADILGSLDGPNASYPPFDRIVPYPKYLVINIYGGYNLITGKLICITNPDQMAAAQHLQSALAEIGFHWEVTLHQPSEGRENVGVQFEVKPLKYGSSSYEIEIEVYSPVINPYQDGIISLVAHDTSGLERGVNTLIQVIQLAFKEFGEDIVSLWIRDWLDD